jgi:hypothetical protein
LQGVQQRVEEERQPGGVWVLDRPGEPIIALLAVTPPFLQLGELFRKNIDKFDVFLCHIKARSQISTNGANT